MISLTAILVLCFSVAFCTEDPLYQTLHPADESPNDDNPIWNPFGILDFLLMPYNPDAELNTPQILARYGYPAESHTVKTEDGYLIIMHRIPCSKEGCAAQGGRGKGQPVFLQHGLLATSGEFIISGPGKALGYILADCGYDVWMGNVRGNRYGYGHVSISNSKVAFWEFNWDDMAMFDIPAQIDYIYQIKEEEGYTNKSDNGNKLNDLLFIGHSMGSTIALALLSTRYEYNEKIRAVFHLAPIGYLSNTRTLLRFLAPFTNGIQSTLELFGIQKIPWKAQFRDFLRKYGCDFTKLQVEICSQFIMTEIGLDSEQFNKSMLPLIFEHVLTSTSVKTLTHYGQEIEADGNFQWYDYGSDENKKRYGHAEPISYNVTKISAPSVLMYAPSDIFASPKDVEKLHELMINTSELYKIPTDHFNHIDFITGIQAPELVYLPLLKFMEKYR